MPTNDFLPFCPTDTGTNLLTESEYNLSADRTSGNKPGVASSKLNNKALRQAAYIVSQLAQYLSNVTATDVLDDATPVKLLAQNTATFKRHLPTITKYTAGSGSHNLTYKFQIASGNATVGATYTNNGVTYTVKATVAAALQVDMSGSGAPLAAGTLTKASGTGDATLTFYAVRAPLFIVVKAAGGGGGGGGAGTASSVASGSGGDTTFDGTNIIAGGGVGGSTNGNGGAGGSATVGTGTDIGSRNGYHGGSVSGWLSGTGAPASGGFGGQGPFGPGGSQRGGSNPAAGGSGTANSGGGGGGGHQITLAFDGAGGGAGAYVESLITAPASTYTYAIGAGGTAGTATGSGNQAGGAGAAGLIIVTEFYQ